MHLPRRQFLRLAAACRRAASDVAHRKCASLPVAPGSHRRPVCCWRRQRHRRAAAGTMAVGTTGSAVHHRESSRCWRNNRDRGCRARPCRWPYAAADRHVQRHQCGRVRKAQLRFRSRHCTGGRHHPRAGRDAGQSSIFDEIGSRIYCLRQGPSRKDHHGVGWHRRIQPRVRRAVQDESRCRIASRAVSRCRAGADRSSRWPSASHV